MHNLYKTIRIAIAVVAGCLIVAAFAGQFYPIKILDVQVLPLVQRGLVHFSLFVGLSLLLIWGITMIFGRIYCSTICPLGLYQEMLMVLFRRKVSPQKNRPYKYFLAAVVWGSLLGGTAVLARLLDPYSLAGSALSGAWLGGSVLLILAVVVWFRGRLFCANICPVGVVLGLISKRAVNRISIEHEACVSCGLCASKCPTGSIDFKNKTVDNETCIKCFNCLGKCRRNGIRYGQPKQAEVPFELSRRRFLVGGAAWALLALSIKGGIDLGKKVASRIKKAILPAGAGSAEDFANKCLNCNLCVQNCPMKIIKKANGDYPTVHIDYKDSFCDYDCHKCAEVCPSGAIKRLSLSQKQKTQIGLAEIDETKCIKCGLCVMKCPKAAIAKEDGGFPVVNNQECIGCGACAAACPVKAITIAALETQKTI